MTQFTLATFNTHWGVRPDRRTPYSLLDVLRRFDADVITLQEYYRDDRADAPDVALAREGYQYVFVPLARAVVEPKAKRRFVGGKGNWGVAILSRCPIVEHRVVPIGRAFADHIGYRNGMEAVIDVAGTPVRVIAVHTSSRVPWGPTANLMTLRRQLPPLEQPAVVAGDMNFWGPAVVRLLPGWRRAVLGRTWPAHRPHSQIDHILVSDAVEVVAGEVLEDVGSDHRPVRARLSV